MGTISVHQRQQAADLARREPLACKPVEVIAGQVGNQAALVLAKGISVVSRRCNGRVSWTSRLSPSTHAACVAGARHCWLRAASMPHSRLLQRNFPPSRAEKANHMIDRETDAMRSAERVVVVARHQRQNPLAAGQLQGVEKFGARNALATLRP